MRWIAISLICGMIFSPMGQAAEEESLISIKAELSNAFITIGDPVHYTITIRHAPTIELLTTPRPPSADILEIKKIEEFKREEDKQMVEGRKMTLTSFRLGEFILEPVKIEYRDPSGEIKSLQTEKLFLTVKSVAAGEEKTDIRGIKSVVSIEGGTGLLLLGLLMILVGAGFGFVIYRRMKSKVPLVQGPEIVMSAEEEAFFHLNQLFDSDLMRRGKVKEYYLRLSEVLRAYFEKRFNILAAESTTYEIIRFLKQKEVDSALIEKIDGVLQAADMAKFAKWKPEAASVIMINKKSKQIVEDATPQETLSGV